MSARLAPDSARVDDRGAVPAALVVLGILVAAAPLGGLFTSAPWRGPLLLTSAAVAVVGVATRPLGRPVGLAAQAATLIGVLTATFGAGTALLGILPTPSTAATFSALAAQAVETITTSPPPAPAPLGVTFALTSSFAATAFVADAFAATFRRPLGAVVPLVVPFLAAVANVDGTLPWGHLAALTLVLALLLLEGRRASLRRWAGPSVVAPWHPGTGLALAAAGLTLAILAASALPHLPTRFLAGGLGRGTGPGQVGFTPSPDLLSDLQNTDTTPVLRYTTDDPEPPPIKVAVASVYADGRWEAREPAVRPSNSPSFPAPAGLAENVDTARHTITVEDTRLEAPYLGAPAPVVGGAVSGALWNQDPATQSLIVDARPDRYSMTYVTVTERVGGAAMSDPDTLLRRGIVTPSDLDTTASSELLRRTADEVTAEATTPAERADALQRWLREDPSFTYSLTLPDPQGQDPVDAFLVSRTGYCVQFATTMILMAREQGIPARMATGFLPGDQEGDERVVRADDAHAWAELYLEDLGWVRYDPTPSRGTAAPGYGPIPTATTGPEPTDTPSASSTGADPTVAARPELDEPGPSGPDAGATTTGGPGLLLPSIVLLLVLLGAALLLGATPALDAWRHRRRLASAATTAEAVEVRWVRLLRRLGDLGVGPPATATVRGTGRFLTGCLADHSPEADLPRAVETVVGVVETARYAAPASRGESDLAEFDRAAAVILDAARARTSRRRRLRARLLPSGAFARDSSSAGFDNDSH